MSDNVDGYFTRWVFVVANLALLSPKQIMKRSEHIKKLRQLAGRRDIDIWFEDECHFQQHGSRCSMWIPPEDIDPVVLHEPTRKSIGFLGAVRPKDGFLITQRAEKFNTDSFQGLLKRLIKKKGRGRKIVVVVDNARWHHAHALEPWLKKHRDDLRLDFLPPYSPELNTIERV
ncbi:MAG: IS630 family transposase [Candidatus Aenigmatarchaeota archaeon]